MVKKSLLMLFCVVLIISLAIAHPHLRKSLTVNLNGNEVALAYITFPANMEHISLVGVGDFRWGATLKVGGDLQAEQVTIAAGTYTIGCVRKANKSWAMVLYPGKLGRGESPDKGLLIELHSMFSTEKGNVDHVSFDIGPGSGMLTGHAVIMWRFGNHYLAGVIS